VVEYNRNYARFSASGAFLDGLRLAWRYMDYLSALADSPHTVTRLDAAHDVPKDAPPILRKLIKAYPREASFTRKPQRTKRIMETREDGQESGTFYIGRHQQGMITGKVYDKQLERANAGDPLPLPLTRYELTFRRGVKCTLRDAAEPEKLFWQYAHTLLLKRPQIIPEWVSGWGGDWSYKAETTPLPALLKHRIESSAEMQAILALADRANCMDFCAQLLAKLVEGYAREHEPEARPEWQPTPAMVAYAKKIV
jgi:hypothetical protein